MSVYKSKRSESSMQFVDTAKKLEAFTLSCCMKAPKRYTFFLTSRIMQLASEEAAVFEEKLKVANHRIDDLEHGT